MKCVQRSAVSPCAARREGEARLREELSELHDVLVEHELVVVVEVRPRGARVRGAARARDGERAAAVIQEKRLGETLGVEGDVRAAHEVQREEAHAVRELSAS